MGMWLLENKKLRLNSQLLMSQQFSLNLILSQKLLSSLQVNLLQTLFSLTKPTLLLLNPVSRNLLNLVKNQPLLSQLFSEKTRRFTMRLGKRSKRTSKDRLTTTLTQRRCTLTDRNWISTDIEISNTAIISTNYPNLDSFLALRLKKLALTLVSSSASNTKQAQLFIFLIPVLSRDAAVLFIIRREKNRSLSFSSRDTVFLFSSQMKMNSFSTQKLKIQIRNCRLLQLLLLLSDLMKKERKAITSIKTVTLSVIKIVSRLELLLLSVSWKLVSKISVIAIILTFLNTHLNSVLLNVETSVLIRQSTILLQRSLRYLIASLLVDARNNFK